MGSGWLSISGARAPVSTVLRVFAGPPGYCRGVINDVMLNSAHVADSLPHYPNRMRTQNGRTNCFPPLMSDVS